MMKPNSLGTVSVLELEQREGASLRSTRTPEGGLK